jgi:hypothetical protein
MSECKHYDETDAALPEHDRRRVLKQLISVSDEESLETRGCPENWPLYDTGVFSTLASYIDIQQQCNRHLRQSKSMDG